MATTNLFNAIIKLKKDEINDIACEYNSFLQGLRTTINKIMIKALDQDETFANFASPLKWVSEQVKLVFQYELLTRNHIQPKKKENKQLTINKKMLILMFTYPLCINTHNHIAVFANYLTTHRCLWLMAARVMIGFWFRE
jgi:hypothetical protein